MPSTPWRWRIAVAEIHDRFFKIRFRLPVEAAIEEGIAPSRILRARLVAGLLWCLLDHYLPLLDDVEDIR
jgi:hypothetical protein